MAGATVAVIKTKVSTVIEDIDRLVEMAGIEQALPKDKTITNSKMPAAIVNMRAFRVQAIARAIFRGSKLVRIFASPKSCTPKP